MWLYCNNNNINSFLLLRLNDWMNNRRVLAIPCHAVGRRQWVLAVPLHSLHRVKDISPHKQATAASTPRHSSPALFMHLSHPFTNIAAAALPVIAQQKEEKSSFTFLFCRLLFISCFFYRSSKKKTIGFDDFESAPDWLFTASPLLLFLCWCFRGVIG